MPQAKEKRGKAEKAKEKPRAKDKKGKGGRKADKVLLAQRRAEERRRHQSILEEMKKPTEDMCLGDHQVGHTLRRGGRTVRGGVPGSDALLVPLQPLPTFSRIPGLVLPSTAFSACLATVEFLHSYGKVLGFDVPRDVPSLSALQDGLLGLGQGPGQLQDLLVRLLQAALYDPGLPAYCQVRGGDRDSSHGGGAAETCAPVYLHACVHTGAGACGCVCVHTCLPVCVCASPRV